ncbi:LysR family transcriptional regulator [Undibacterium terreum]|uniref:LysR family transcriptional regulator n=2 Tax=Undibacterium terreum TaxID=1224302 RepID=A0A916XEV8_9BURK|nr:LysR family transcriptional regulator [Undibacterium terreum]
MHCFIRVVETGSFSAVARELEIGQPNISRHIASLENELGTRLLYRSTRQLTITPEGQRYYAQARQALDMIDQAESDLRGQQNPRGLLRVACPASLGIEKIVEAMPQFLGQFPDVELELRLSDEYIDLVGQGVDVAIRGGELKDSALRARRIGISERVYVAGAAYLEEHPAPLQPADLLQHQCIIYTLLAGGKGWPFKDGELHVNGRVRLDDLRAIHRAALANLGIAYLPSWMVVDELRSGALKLVLADYVGPPSPVNAVYSAERLLPQRATVFIDFITTLFTSIPGLNGSPLL